MACSETLTLLPAEEEGCTGVLRDTNFAASRGGGCRDTPVYNFFILNNCKTQGIELGKLLFYS